MNDNNKVAPFNNSKVGEIKRNVAPVFAAPTLLPPRTLLEDPRFKKNIIMASILSERSTHMPPTANPTTIEDEIAHGFGFFDEDSDSESDIAQPSRPVVLQSTADLRAGLRKYLKNKPKSKPAVVSTENVATSSLSLYKDQVNRSGDIRESLRVAQRLNSDSDSITDVEVSQPKINIARALEATNIFDDENLSLQKSHTSHSPVIFDEAVKPKSYTRKRKPKNVDGLDDKAVAEHVSPLKKKKNVLEKARVSLYFRLGATNLILNYFVPLQERELKKFYEERNAHFAEIEQYEMHVE